MRLISSCLLLAAFLAFTGQASASEQDVHYGLTFWLARKAGFDKVHAEIIASAAQSYDEGQYTPATWTVAWILISKPDPNASLAVRDSHFPSDTELPAEPDQRRVVPDNAHAERALRASLAALADPEGSPINSLLSSFGRSLHPFEDSWAHQGVPDSPFRPFKQVNSNLTWGHPCNGGGWWRHDADLTYLHVDETEAMAYKVYLALNDVLSRRPELRSQASVPWNSLISAVRDFAQADTKVSKRLWFRSDPTVLYSEYSYDFVASINLPDSATPNHAPVYDCSETMKESFLHSAGGALSALEDTIQTSIQSLFNRGIRARDEAEVRSLMYEFARELYISKDIKSASKLMDIKGEKLPGLLPNERISTSILLASFALPDHGLANSLGHGRQTSEEVLRYLSSSEASTREEVKGSFRDVDHLLRAPTYSEFTSSDGLRKLELSQEAKLGNSPFLIAPLRKSLRSKSSLAFGIRGRSYAVMFTSSNAPDDLMFLIVGKSAHQWTVRRFYWLAS